VICFVIAVLSSFGAEVARARPREIAAGDERPDGNYYQFQVRYSGGTNTLPYGMADAAHVLNHARGMPVVLEGVSRMTSRGYIRRPDLDCSLTQGGHSLVAISFEKPGENVMLKQPVLMVITRACEVPGYGFVPATQVFGGLTYDSAGVIRCTSTPADSAICIQGTLVGGSAADAVIASALGGGFGTHRDDEDFVYKYSAHEPRMGGGWDWRSWTSPGMQELWHGWAREVSTQSIQAALGALPAFRTGIADGIIASACAGASAFYTASNRYWSNPPDTTGQH
jgi:hypothetical protein